MREYDDILKFNKEEFENWETLQKVDENKPAPHFSPKPLSDDNPGLVQAVEEAKNKFINTYLEAREAERESNKVKYNLYKDALKFVEKVNNYDSIINNYEKDLEEAKNDKDKLEHVKAQYNTAVELRKQINENELSEARSIISIHDLEVANDKKKANEDVKTVMQQTKINYMNNRDERLIAMETKRYEDKLKEDVAAREELEKKNSMIWTKFLQNEKNGAKIKIDDSISDDEKNHYNKNLKEAIDKVKKAPLDDIFKQYLFYGRYDNSFKINELTDRELRDAEQVFDRIFMDLHAFHGKYDNKEGILPKIKFKGASVLFSDLNAKDINDLGPDVRLYDVVDKLLKKVGIDVKEVEAEKFNQYAKALFLYSVCHQSIKFEYVPKYFENTNGKLKSKDADNNPEYCISSEKIILNERSEEKEEYKNRNQIKGSNYKRLRYDEMQSIYTAQKDLIITVVPKREEPEIKVEENNINNEENIIINDNINDNNIVNNNENQQNNIRNENGDIIPIRMPNFSEEYINAKVEEFLRNNPGNLNITAMDAYIKAINNLGSNYSVFSEQIITHLNASGEATRELAGVALDVKNYPGGTRMNFCGVEAVRVAFAKAFVMAEELAETFKDYHNQLEDNDIDDEINDELRIMAHDCYDIMTNEAYEDVLKIDPTFHSSALSAYATFPYNSFKQENGTYKSDGERYKQMLERIPFFTQLKDRLNHIKNDFLGYRDFRIDAEYELTDDDITKYREAYIQNIENTKNNFEKIRSVKLDDPDINSLQAFASNVNYNFKLNWQQDRLGDIVMKKADMQLSALDRGWPVEDVGFIVEMYEVEKNLRSMAAGEGEANAEQVEQAKSILKSMEVSLDKVKNSIITSDEVREDILDTLDAPIKEYIQLRQEVPFEGKFYGTPAIDKIHKMARLREVKPIELKNEYRTKEENGFKKPTITFEQIRENIRVMLDDLHSVELWKGSGEFKDMKISLTNLKKYADERMGIIDPDKPVEEEMLRSLNELKEHLVETTNKTKRYLNHKAEDFRKDKGRRERDGKQKAEQSRIKMAINQLENLTFLTDMIDSYENAISPMTRYLEKDLPKAKEEALSRINKKISEENRKLLNAKNADEYIQSMGSVIILNLQKNDNYYKPRENESYEDFKNRIEQTGARNITKKEINEMASADSIFKDFLKEHKEKFNEENYKRLNSGMVNGSFLQKNMLAKNKQPEKKMDKKQEDIKKELKEDSSEISKYKTNLVSNKRKKKRADNQNQKKAARQEEAAKLNRRL